MGARTARHIIGAGIGVAAAPAVAFLFLDGTRGAAFRSLVILSNHQSAMPQGVDIRLGSAWLATVELLAAGVLAGVLAGARRISPVAPLVAGMAFLAIELHVHSSMIAMLTILRHAPASLVYGQDWQPATETLAASGWLVLFGGMVLAAGAISGRWRREPGSVPGRPTPTAGPALEQIEAS